VAVEDLGVSPASASLHVCLVGAGSASRRHARELRSLHPSVTFSVVSRTASSATALGAELGTTRATTDLSEALAAHPDVVVIATPPRSHVALTRTCIEAGAAVVLEKPATVEVAELRALLAEAALARVTLLIAENQHYAPQVATVRRLLADGGLGRPLFVNVDAMHRGTAPTWRSDPAEMPYGPLHEGGVHWVRRLRSITTYYSPCEQADEQEVMAWSPARVGTDIPGEETVSVLARHGSGLVSTLRHSWVASRPDRFLGPLVMSSVVCSNGRVLFDGARLAIKAKGSSARIRRVKLERTSDPNGYTAMWRDYLRVVGEGAEPNLRPDLVVDDMSYVDAAYRSLRTGFPQAVTA
jgi:predicted dehydrogenase